jgi:hypothetical protein
LEYTLAQYIVGCQGGGVEAECPTQDLEDFAVRRWVANQRAIRLGEAIVLLASGKMIDQQEVQQLFPPRYG